MRRRTPHQQHGRKLQLSLCVSGQHRDHAIYGHQNNKRQDRYHRAQLRPCADGQTQTRRRSAPQERHAAPKQRIEPRLRVIQRGQKVSVKNQRQIIRNVRHPIGANQRIGQKVKQQRRHQRQTAADKHRQIFGEKILLSSHAVYDLIVDAGRPFLYVRPAVGQCRKQRPDGVEHTLCCAGGNPQPIAEQRGRHPPPMLSHFRNERQILSYIDRRQQQANGQSGEKPAVMKSFL